MDCFVTKADSAFYLGAAALIRSLNQTNPGIAIFVLDGGLARSEVESLQSLGANVTTLKKRYTPRAETIEGTHYNETIFALMELEAIPFTHAIHLDADAIVLGSLAPVFESLEDFDFVGVHDFPPLTLAQNIGDDAQVALAQTLFPISPDALTNHAYNAGVFALSARSYRTILPIMERAYRSQLILPLRDQTLLNIAIVAAALRTAPPLSLHFNFRHRFRRSPETRWDAIEHHNGMLVPRFNSELVRIVHFIGPNKPWHAAFDQFPDALRVWRQFSEDGLCA